MALSATLLALPSSGQDVQLNPNQEARTTPITELVKNVGPSVVNIYTQVVQKRSRDPFWDRFFQSERHQRTSLGSGILIDAAGYIVTSAHVIRVDAPSITVRMNDESEHLAELINIDPIHDIALLKINTDTPLPYVTLGYSDDLMVGETVVAIGNPLGNENSVTAGIISSLWRDVRMSEGDGSPVSPETHGDFIQIDAPINPGNSGGPLLNILGDVIGITSGVAEGAQGVGFATPINRVRDQLVNSLFNPRRNGVVTGMALSHDRSNDTLVVEDVREGGPASQAGLRTADILSSVNGVPLHWEFDFVKAMSNVRPGDAVEMGIQRGEEMVTLKVHIEEAPASQIAIWERLGLDVVDHPRQYGVWIKAVDPTGPARRVGLRPGDVIDTINALEIDNISHLAETLSLLPVSAVVSIKGFRRSLGFSGVITLQ